MELNITHLMNSIRPDYYAASAAELGQDAGRITWDNAMDHAEDEPLLTGPEALEAFRDYIRTTGGWNYEECRQFTDHELNALCLQFIAGDLREAGFERGIINWSAYELRAAEGQISARLYMHDGNVYWNMSN